MKIQKNSCVFIAAFSAMEKEHLKYFNSMYRCT